MITIETYYLIDYENVSSAGLAGCEKLNKSDHIVIFFTTNAKKIDMTDIADHGATELKMVEVPAGKQSIDIHISSYLGYLAGKYEEEKCSVVIVSKDTDFDNIIKFWKNKMGIKASRTQQIKMPDPEPLVQELPDLESSDPQPADQTEVKAISAKSKERRAVNNEIMKLVSKAGYTNDVITYVASTVVKNLGVKNGKQQIYRTIVSKYGQLKGREVYNHIKKHI